MSVVGFDIGNENCVIAVVKQRGLDVLLNDESKRETPAVVCFGEKQRFLGSAGAASAMMHPKTTVSQLKRLIGRRYKDPGVQDELRMFPVETSEGSDGGVLIHLRYLGEVHMFSPVQIMAMLFVHLKDIAERSLEAGVSDCVIGVPSYFTELQRRAYLSAAAIAGLRPLRLVHDCMATALSYGIYKTDFSSGGRSCVAFVDIGQCDTQVSVVAFEAGHMRVLSHAFDRDLGGRDFDEVLFRHFAAEFKERYCIDVYQNVKACVRLRAACEKAKKILSANAEAPLNIECLMEEKDVKGFIKREEFENLASGLLERITIPCSKALADAGLTAEKIHSVELVGSGSRIPAINRLLTSLFKREPRRSLNASECVARGCALQCAMLSPVFRVREYEVQESFPYSIGLAADDGPVCSIPNGVLFPKGQSIPSTKILKLHRHGLFHLEAFYAIPSELPLGTDPKISCFTIGPFQVPCNEKAKVKVKIQLNLHGIVTVESASLIDKDDNESAAPYMAHERVDRMDTSESDVRNSTSSQHSPDDVTNKKSSRRLEIPVSENVYGGITKAELSEAQDKEIQLAQQDRNMEQTKDKRNALESYVYDMRSKLLDTYRNFASDQERENISRSLQQTEEWLYEDGEDETEYAYTSKMEDLRKLLDPVENRFKDEEARAEATKNLLKCIMDYQVAVNSLPTDQRELIINECHKAEQWLRQKIQQQECLPKNTDPVVWSGDIRSRREDLDMTCKKLFRSIASPSQNDVAPDP